MGIEIKERFFLSDRAVLRRLEMPAVYHTGKDELYELDEESFGFLNKCACIEGHPAAPSEFTGYCLAEDILNRERFLPGHPPVLNASAPSLRYLELQITDKCNLKCRHCYIGGGRCNEIPAGQVHDILGEFEALQGLRLLITGGEPLLHRAFGEINSFLPRFRLRKVLFTNGLLLTKEVLGNLNVDEIQISIDGMEKGHDLLRGGGSFRKAMEALMLALQAGFAVSVATMIHPGNLDEFDAMEARFGELGVKDWTVDVPCAAGSLKDNAAFQLGPEIAGKYLRYGFGEGPHGSEPGFGCGLHLMSVLADGKIAKCTFYGDRPLGSIEEGIYKSWRSLHPVRLSDLKCDCEWIESCRGGCRYRAELLGDPMGKDHYRCKSLL